MSYTIETKDNNKVWQTGYTIYCQSGIGSPFNAFEYDKIQGENEQFFPTAEGAMTFLQISAEEGKLDSRFTYFVQYVCKFCK